MTEPTLDIVAIGNAIVDVIAQADEAFLGRNGLDKGVMTLIDADRARTLYDVMGSALEMSGGSAANTLAGLASLGGSGAYIGSGSVVTRNVPDDALVVERSQQTVREGWAKRFREMKLLAKKTKTS